MQHGSIDLQKNALNTTTPTRPPFHQVQDGRMNRPTYGKTPEKNVSSVNKQKDAQKSLQDFYHNEELRNIRLRRLYPPTNTTVSANSTTQPKKIRKPGNETNPVYTLWFSCNNVNVCVILTASVASLISILLVLVLVGLCLHCRKSRSKFSPEEWWKQPAATPLLLIPSMKEDDDQVPKKELVKLRKYLKKYMSISQATQNRAADNMPDIPEERDSNTESMNSHCAEYRRNSAKQSGSILSELSDTMDNSLNQRPSVHSEHSKSSSKTHSK